LLEVIQALAAASDIDLDDLEAVRSWRTADRERSASGF
jgi:hypothetical protein